jgi:hypothetical protein
VCEKGLFFHWGHSGQLGHSREKFARLVAPLGARLALKKGLFFQGGLGGPTRPLSVCGGRGCGARLGKGGILKDLGMKTFRNGLILAGGADAPYLLYQGQVVSRGRRCPGLASLGTR